MLLLASIRCDHARSRWPTKSADREIRIVTNVGGVSAAVSKTAAAPIERVKLLIQNQVRFEAFLITTPTTIWKRIIILPARI